MALIHDFLLDVRGAERVFEAICDLWPDADLFTAVYDEEGTEGRFADRRVHTSFLQRLRPKDGTFRALLPLYPRAMERLDLSGYDLVVSSSSAWAHGVIAAPGAVHVCYCHNPFRYAWGARERTLGRGASIVRPALEVAFHRWRDWDRRVSRDVDAYVANSETTRRRIARSFGRESTVIYPPVDTSRFTPGRPGDHHLIVTKLMSHKHVDVAVEAFNRLGRKLVIVGDGPEARRLSRLAGPNVELVGHVPDEHVAELMRTARAFVVTSVEEFGIAAVEAQAAGRPVVALDAGGVRETIIEGETGAFYAESDPDALAEVVEGFDPLAIDPAACVASAMRFDTSRFGPQLKAVVSETASRLQAERVPRARSRRRAAA